MTGLLKMFGLMLAFLLICALPVPPLQAEGPSNDPALIQQPSSPPLAPSPVVSEKKDYSVSVPELLAPGIYRIGLVKIDKADHSLSFPAQINLDEGLLEYLLVRSGGKTHESLFRTEADPYDIQLACLLLDLEGSLEPLAYQGAPQAPKGDPVRLTVSMSDAQGRIHSFSPESWLKKVLAEKAETVDPLNWVFVGSTINEGRFTAQMEGSIIALYHDPASIIDNASPGGESDEIWFVDKKTVPSLGTPVTITIKAVKYNQRGEM